MASIVELLLSIFLPLYLCYWISGKLKEWSSSNLDAKRDIPDVYFSLKRWWAEYCLARKKKQAKNTCFNLKTSDLMNSKIKDKDSINSVSFYGADQKGNSLFIKFSHRAFKVAEATLLLTTSDDQLYVLPDCPETTLTSSFNQNWTAAGLKIEFLEYQQRWRIVYNGMLRNFVDGQECSDENVQHIRLNFIFSANTQPLRWPEDWSTKLHSEALACEPWKSPEWINKIKLLEYAGFDQWGSMIGQVTYNDGAVSTLYLRGFHQHRWGKHESHEFHESVALTGIMLFGAMYHLDMSSTKYSFPQLQIGQFRNNSEKICQVDQVGLKLSDFPKENLNKNAEYKTWLVADNTKHDILIKLNKSITFYHGHPWIWENKIVTVKVEMDGKSGFGLMQFCSPYNGTCRARPTTQLQFLKQLSNHVQRNDYVVHFDDGKCQNENVVGGKGFSLAMLASVKDAAFIVPKGFCVTVFSLELQLHTHKKLQKMISDIEDVSVGKKDGDLQKYCQEAMKIIQSTPIVDDVKAAILKGIRDLETENDCNRPSQYAIRSSAVGEDSEETSAAGQNATYLGVQGVANIIKCIAMCWASLFSYQSVKYRQQHGMFVKASMGVCVQRMVNAEVAGVMFTRHPTTGDPSDIIITANYGLGESVVSAAVEPDTIVVQKNWKNEELTMKSLTPGNKKQKILANDNGIVTVELNDEENQQISLSRETALQLAAIGVDLESLFGSARDIEWAVANGNIYLLQARPITTLYTWTDFEITHELDTYVPSDIDLLTFANIGEVFPYPVSPLTASVIVTAFNKGIANTLQFLGGTFSCTVGLKCCLNYYNTFLRDPTKEITLLNKVVDVAICGGVVVTPEIHKIACERNGIATRQRRFIMTCKMIKELTRNNGVAETAKKIRQNFTFNAENFHTAYSLYNEINQRLEEYEKVSECHMHTSRVCITYQIFSLSLLTQGYKDLMSEHFADIALLFGSCGDIVSGEVVKRLKKIVIYIKKSEKEDEFKEIDPGRGIDWLKINCPPAATEVDDLLEKHGTRCIQEMDFISEPWCLRPESLISTLQTIMVAPERSDSVRTLGAEETVELLKTPKSAVTKWLLKKLVPRCRNAVVLREMTKAIFVSVIHTFRLSYRRLGRLMVLEGYLPSEDLIFFLTNAEIGQLLTEHNTTLIQKAFRRKRIFPCLQKVEYPEVNIGMPIPAKTGLDTTFDSESTKVEGTPVCGGSVLSRACVITDLADAKEIQQGDILIIHATDIAWSPYFPLLSGVVTELGGLISHGAVVAREYGLPCIIGAKRATQLFRTGDTVLLTADTGVLQLVKKAD